MARSGRKRVYLTRQSLPALSFVVLGLLMMSMPFLMQHGSYLGDVMVAHGSEMGGFDKTEVLIGQASMDGAVGIILNVPLSDEQHSKLSPFIRDSGIPISYGGPIEVSEKLFVIEEKSPTSSHHEPSFDIRTWDNAVRLTPDLLDKIRASLKNGEQHYRVFTGYAAWGSLQLEEEALLKNKWSSHPATHDLIFQNGPASTWDALDQAEKTKATAIPRT